jgi:hypothetical protein
MVYELGIRRTLGSVLAAVIKKGKSVCLIKHSALMTYDRMGVQLLTFTLRLVGDGQVNLPVLLKSSTHSYSFGS